MDCEICNQRPANLYLTHKALNKHACWPCAQWAITAATDDLKLRPYQQNQPDQPKQPEAESAPKPLPVTMIVSEGKKSRIIIATKEIVAWALAR